MLTWNNNHMFPEQRAAGPVVPMTNEAFGPNNETAVYWMTSAAVLINSHGKTIMVDPNFAVLDEETKLSEVFGMRLLAMPTIRNSEIKKIDAILYTHADEDHLGEHTALELLHTGAMYHSTPLVCERLAKLGVPEERLVVHGPLDEFKIGTVDVKMTWANHPHQFCLKPERYSDAYRLEDCCGFKFYTQDGVIWDPGDTSLLGNHLDNEDVDVYFMDCADDTFDVEPPCHFGRDASVKLANYLKQADLIPFHWGTFHAPDKSWCACNPEEVRCMLENPERLLILKPGEKYVLKRKAR
ncbi:MAG: MBL fold metallo-hydrolase [Ruminiclostridium sp.]